VRRRWRCVPDVVGGRCGDLIFRRGSGGSCIGIRGMVSGWSSAAGSGRVRRASRQAITTGVGWRVRLRLARRCRWRASGSASILTGRAPRWSVGICGVAGDAVAGRFPVAGGDRVAVRRTGAGGASAARGRIAVGEIGELLGTSRDTARRYARVHDCEGCGEPILAVGVVRCRRCSSTGRSRWGEPFSEREIVATVGAWQRVEGSSAGAGRLATNGSGGAALDGSLSVRGGRPRAR
jgi:hypothetical protein